MYDHADVNVTTSDSGAVAIVTCDKNYYFPNNLDEVHIQCHPNGSWKSDEDISCKCMYEWT